MVQNEKNTIYERDGQIYIDKICCGSSKTHIIEECGKIRFVKRVDETGRIIAIFYAQTEFFSYWYDTVRRTRLKVTSLEQEEGYYYELEECAGVPFVKKIDTKGIPVDMYLCSQIVVQDYEMRWRGQEEGYYYELEECAGLPFAKKIDTKGNVKDIYSWEKVRFHKGVNNLDNGYMYRLEKFGKNRGYCYELEECAGLPFAKKIDETTNEIEEIYTAFGELCAGGCGRVCGYLIGNDKQSYELKAVVNRPYIICEYQNKVEVYLLKDVLREPQAKRIEIGDWIGKFEELDLEEICRNDTTYFYDKKSKTLCDTDGVIIISGCN